ncbi:S-layer homology domain-containing protein [Paenibacillus sp. YIM B09110]|uniref:S-layer homology domain-containing protein n=1 Tax=Paenibacillus sp. YIM B09110 TaxID=3126102 RepID=UPI00301D7EC4
MNQSYAEAGPESPVREVTTSEWGSVLSVTDGNLIDNENGTYSLWLTSSNVTFTYENDTENVNSEDTAAYQKAAYGAQPNINTWNPGTFQSVVAGVSSDDGLKQDIFFRISEEQIKVTVHFMLIETSPNAYNTDTDATLWGTANEFDEETYVGFEYSKDVSFTNSSTTEDTDTSIGSNSTFFRSISELERGTTYYYRAYAVVDDNFIYGDTQSLKTAAIASLDVKAANGSVLTKSPAAFSYGTTSYEVHVPHDTTIVNVVETVDLGTAPAIQDLSFEVDGNQNFEEWVTLSGTSQAATHEVSITTDLTTVCVGSPVFTGLGTLAGACDSDQFEVKIIRDAVPFIQTLYASYNTDVDAFLMGSAAGYDQETIVGFEYSTDANFSNSATTEDIDTAIGSHPSFYRPISELERGTTYYFRAYAIVNGTPVYGAAKTFKTATITRLDVKGANGQVITKSPAAFNYNTKSYEVHVPHSTTSVSVVETVDLGTAIAIQDLSFEVAGNQDFERWNAVSGTIQAAAHQVSITEDLTTVCVGAPVFTGLGTPVGACGSDQFEVKIIRDAAPSKTSTTTTEAVLVLESDPNKTDQSAKTAITQIVGQNLTLSATLMTSDGKPLDIPDIQIGADGSFSLSNVPPGVYKVALSIVAPTGEKLAGRSGTLTVNSDGTARLEAGLIDPYGIVTDAVTGKTIDGAKVTLHWTDTELNRSKGRKASDLVVLPILPDFAPNQNRDPQSTVNGGQYGWMVFPDGDYYILAEKDGYETFDSRNDTRDELQGDDSYIQNGNIHVGTSIVQYDFVMEPKVVDTGDHKPYMLGYPDGSFRPERGLTRAETAAILNRLFAGEIDKAAAGNPFADVKKSHWAANDIAVATAQRWMVGYTDGSFLPEQQVTRAELAQILLNVKKWSSAAEITFADAKGHWAEKAIAQLYTQGLIAGYPDGTFRPNEPIKRVEADIIFNQVTGRTPWKVQVEPIWTDVDSSYWGFDAVMEASVPHPYEEFESGLENWTSN